MLSEAVQPEQFMFIGNPHESSEYYKCHLDNVPRFCTHETLYEGPAPSCIDGHWLKVWTLYYSDGTYEQLKLLERKTS